MSTQKAKFELFARLQSLGFTYEEAAALRRIEMTLQRWGERECGDGSDWGLERDEKTGKPRMVYHGATYGNKPHSYPVADRKAGALRRLRKIVADRNTRNWVGFAGPISESPGFIFAYHQGDCRGCNLYLVTREQLTDRQTGELLPIDQYYTRGLAVCA